MSKFVACTSWTNNSGLSKWGFYCWYISK